MKDVFGNQEPQRRMLQNANVDVDKSLDTDQNES